VPVAVAIWAVVAAVSGGSFVGIGIRTVGALAAAGLAHRLYGAYAFVPRADPMASVFVALLVCAAPDAESPVEAVRSLAALIALLGCGDQVLRMHRQPSTSGIGFRAGVLAGCAAVLEPATVGGIAALYAAQTLARPFSIREWLMAGIGAVWPMALATGVTAVRAALAGATGPDLAAAVRSQWMPVGPDLWERAGALSADVGLASAGAGLAVLALGGWVRVLSARRAGGLRAESTRLHLFVFSLVAAVGVAVWPWGAGTMHLWNIAAVWCAFGLAGGAPEVRHVGRAERVLWWMGGALLAMAVFAH
jgi:hypothetical protein